VLRDLLRLAVFCLSALAAGALAPERAAAQVSGERGASILVFPKVVADASGDTALQLANLSDNRIDAYCAYVDGSSGSWQSLGFGVALGPQRPLHWSAARGRLSGAGEDPIDIPAAPLSFRGELLCVQVDGSGAPLSGNDLAGQATLTDLASGDVAAYAALGLRGSGLNDGDEFLCIGEPSDNCFLGVAEYDPCPAEWILTLPADGAEDAQLGAGSRLSTRLAVAPCSQNLRDTTPGTVDIEISVFNEMAQRFTGMTSVTCWADLSLADVADEIFTRGMLGSDYAEARLGPAEGSGGFMLVAQTTRATAGAPLLTSSVAVSPHHQGGATAADLIVLPGIGPQ
jgi:hypothetical protein